MFALVDCNNFFVSCERVFAPSLENKPVAVLSNNDGCIIARSNEVKALGIPMGAPYFKYQDAIKTHNIKVFSSNYQLYGDMSQRVMSTLKTMAVDMEIYSIDEAFLKLDPCQNLFEHGIQIRAQIKKWTGLPVCVGIAPTKTLAKIANHMAKKNKSGPGVFVINNLMDHQEMKKKFPIEDIWGISKKWGLKLRQQGIGTLFDFYHAPPKLIRKLMSVVGERILLEINGIVCHSLEMPTPRKNIMSSKSFGVRQTDLKDIEYALSCHAASACEKMRNQKSRAQGICVFLRTSPFSKEPFYHNSAVNGFSRPTNDTSFIMTQAKELLKTLYIPGLQYQKTGVMLLDLIPDTFHQPNLFENSDPSKKDHLLQILDSLNEKMGKRTVFYAAQGMEKSKTINLNIPSLDPQMNTNSSWNLKCDNRSPRYTTQWNELASVW